MCKTSTHSLYQLVSGLAERLKTSGSCLIIQVSYGVSPRMHFVGLEPCKCMMQMTPYGTINYYGSVKLEEGKRGSEMKRCFVKRYLGPLACR